jgi:hypothetical protein
MAALVAATHFPEAYEGNFPRQRLLENGSPGRSPAMMIWGDFV